ncbi:hypothetical protein [Mycobacterium sp. C31M]
MITARELADELGVPEDDVMTALHEMRELTLTPDSSVRDNIAEEIRERFREGRQIARPQADTVRLASDEQLERLRKKLGGTEATSPLPQIDLTPPPPRIARQKPRNWRPGNPPLPKVVRALADQIVMHSDVLRRPPGVVFADELAEAQSRADGWMKQRIECGAFFTDDDIVRWIVAFPHEVLRPEEVFELSAAGLAAQDVQLRLWYGRINSGRLTLLQQIRRGDLSIGKAAADIAEFKRRQGAS